jgi:Tfp pilus assembly pilus retraction ATPase PilT
MYKEINQLPKTKAQMYDAMLEARGELAQARHEIRELRAKKRKLDLLLHVENSKVIKFQKSDKEQKAQLRELRKHRREANMLLKSTMNELEQERLEAELERKRSAQEMESDKVRVNSDQMNSLISCCMYSLEHTLVLHTTLTLASHHVPPLLTGENEKPTGG